MYIITNRQKRNARRIGVTIKVSSNKKKKLMSINLGLKYVRLAQ
jgi:hypothetical protein